MKILVTGGAGYIGSHACVSLLKRGFEVVVLDDFSNSSPKVLQRIKAITGKEVQLIEGSLLNVQLMQDIFHSHKPQAVIHFAGKKAVGESEQLPLDYYETNITGTINLLKVMKQYSCKKLIFSSSATVYGNPQFLPYTESHPTGAINPYGRTKEYIEKICIDLHKSDNQWDICLLRYFNPVGAHDSGLIGENPRGIPNNLLPYITQVAIGKRSKLSVFGADYPTKDGTGVRDYIHVEDLVEGHILALQKMLDQPMGLKIYNLGTGIGYSVFEMVQAFEKASNQKIPYEIIARRPGDIAECWADATAAKNDLKWQATKNLETMMKDSWHWQSNNPNGYDD